MTIYSIDKTFSWQGRLTPKVGSVLKMFGLDIDRLADSAVHHKCEIEISPGQIVFLTGPSGAGKSVLLRELFSACKTIETQHFAFLPSHESRATSHVIDLDSIKLSGKRAVIDCIDGNFIKALKTLSIAGLSDVFAVLNTPAHLSEGQKYRFKLAKALCLINSPHKYCHPERSEGSPSEKDKCLDSQKMKASHFPIIFADEFCSSLDRITASVIAYQIRKFATRRKITFVLASAREDILPDLAPDIIVIKHLNGQTEVIHKHVQ